MSMKDGNSFVILTTALWLYSNPCKWISCQNVWQLLEDRACRYSCVTHVSSPAEMPCGTMKTRLRDICTILHNTSLTELWHFIVHCTTLLTAPISLLFHRSAFTMHVEAGHSAVPEEGPKDLRCPLCLYHTKYKRNMIDHIVLHRGNDSPVCACLMREMLNNAPVFLIGFIKFSPLYICTSMLNRPSALQYPLFLSECTSY